MRVFPPSFIPVFFIPTNGCLTLLDALHQPDSMDNLWSRLTAFVPGRAERMVFAGMDGVFKAEFEWIQAKSTGNFLHMTFDRPKSLWYAIAAKRSSGRRVGVNNICIKADIGRFPVWPITNVQCHGFGSGIASHGDRVAPIGTGIT